MKAVTSRDNPAYKAMAKLAASTSERKKRGRNVLEGVHVIAAFLDSGREVESMMVSREALARPEVARLASRVAPSGLTVVSDALFAAISTVESPTGILAAVPTPRGAEVPADAPLVLLLEDVRDPGNVGTLLRSAAAAGAGHALLSRTCAFAWSHKVIRAAMGAHFAINVVEGADLVEFLSRYRGTSVALSGSAQHSIHDLDLAGPVAIVVGNEGAGISADLLAAATMRARIPMPGSAESLNAAVAGSIALFEVLRQRSDASQRRGHG